MKLSADERRLLKNVAARRRLDFGLHCFPSGVYRAIVRLTTQGLIVDDKWLGIRLTEAGRQALANEGM